MGGPITIDALEFELTQDNALRLAGMLDTDAAHKELRRRLTQLHVHIRDKRLSSFTVDLRRLNFVNSSAIRLFVDWASQAETSRYKLRFVIDRTITWHRLSFSVLRSLAPSSVEIIESSGGSSTTPSK
jgi:hypothetical protein